MSLVNDVLDISRIDSGRMSLNDELFSLAGFGAAVPNISSADMPIRSQAAWSAYRIRKGLSGDISRIDSGRMSLNDELFSLADLIHDVAVCRPCLRL